MTHELLAFLFFGVAVIYSMAGFGGGSSYVALLALFAVPFASIPPVALICNIIVAASGSYYLMSEGHLSPRLLLPFIIASVPMSYLGGRIVIEKEVMLLLLASSLSVAGVRMLVSSRQCSDVARVNTSRLWAGGMSIGALLGLLSGMVGIGGGIFLSPILHMLKWGTPRQIAAVASAFILVNSIGGVAGQLHKHADITFLQDYTPLFVAVLLGGQIGGLLTARKLSQTAIRRATALLVLFASMRIFANVLLRL